ncbi:MAG: TetR/AcrR family transcriptional regulator [Lachnospiraceae bacterium]
MARPNKNYEPKKEALAKLAFDLFIEHGYESTTITHIMRAAGLTKAGMYHYFSSKEEILDAAIDYGITQDIEEIRRNMDELSVEEKMLFFIRGNAVPNEFLQKLFQLKQHNQNFYAAYRIRECLVHAYIPIMEGILIEGTQKGVYRTQYPRQTAEFVVLCSKALAEPNMLPSVNNDDLKLRIHVFLQLMSIWLNPNPEHAKQITALFEKILSEIHGDNA